MLVKTLRLRFQHQNLGSGGPRNFDKAAGFESGYVSCWVRDNLAKLGRISRFDPGRNPQKVGDGLCSAVFYKSIGWNECESCRCDDRSASDADRLID